jgi:hypothetical protein
MGVPLAIRGGACSGTEITSSPDELTPYSAGELQQGAVA